MQKPSHTETSTMDQLQQYSDHVDVKEEIDGQQEVEIPTPETTEQHNHQDIKDEEELHSDSGSKSLLYDKQQECVKTDDDDDDGNVYESKQQIRFLTHEVDASDLHLEDSGRQLTSADANGETSLNEESGLMEVDKGDVDTDESRSNDGGNNEHSHRHRSLDYDENVMDESEDGNQSDVPIMNEETDIVPNSEYQPNLIPITNATTTTALVVSSISSTSSGSSIAYPQLTMINVATNDVTSGQLPMNATNQVTPQDQSALPENIANQNVLRSGRVSVPPVRLGFEVPESSKKKKNNKIPTCSECGYSNVDPENVSRHIWRVHFDQIDTTNPVDSIEDMQPSVTEPASTSPKPIVEPMLSNTVTSNEHQQSLHNQVLEQIGDSTDHSVNVMTGTVASYTQFQPATSQQASCEDQCVLPNLENRIEEINQLYTNNSNESTVKPNEQSLVLRSAFTLVIPSKAIVKSDEQKVKIINAECDDSDRECMITDESIQINGTEQINPPVLLNDSQGGTSYIHSVQTEEQIVNHKEIEIPVPESVEQLQHKVIKQEEADWTSSGSSSTLPPATETEPSSTQFQPSTSQLPSAEGCIKPKKEEEDEDDKKFEFEWDECDCADCRPAREIKIEFCQTHGIPTSMVSSSVELKCNNAAHCKRSLRPCKRVKKEEEEEQNRVIKIEFPDGECEVKQENEQTEDEQIVPASNEAGMVQIRAGGDGRASGEVSEDDKTEISEDENELRDTDDLRDGGQINAQDGLDDGDDSDSESNSSDDEEEDDNGDESLEDMEVDDDDDEVAQDVTGGEKSDEEETEIDEADDLNENDAQDGNEIEENGHELNDLVDQRRGEEGAQERGEGDDDASGSDSSNDDDQTELDEDEAQETEPGQLSRRKKHICEHCGKGFRYLSILNLHIRTHTGEKPFECSWTGCGKVFVSNSHLKSHFCTHTKEKTFKCSWGSCTKTFTEERYLKVHLRRHAGDKPIKCSWDGCNLTFIYAFNMKKHLRTHSERRRIECTWAGCTKTFTEKSVLDVHLKIHEGKKPFKCTWENCNKTFTLKYYLTVHLKRHNGLYAFACDQCEKRYMHKRDLVQHNRTHTGEKPYKCSWSDCTKGFTHKGLLDQHYKYHVNKSKLPFKCTWPKCQKAFALKERMDKHLNIHKKQQNFAFSCDQCMRKCKDSYDLKVHIATHSSELNFVCTFVACKKKFKTQRSLACHLKKKHN